MQHTTIHISLTTLLKVLALVVGVFLFLALWNIVFIVFAALLLAALIDPFASWFAARKIPRSIAVLLVYILLFGMLTGAVALLSPVVSEDIPQLIERFEILLADVQQTSEYAALISTFDRMGISFENGGAGTVSPQTGGALRQALGAVGSVFQGIASFLLILVIAYYMVTEDDPLKKILHSVVPTRHIDYVVSLLSRIQEKLAAWIRGQLILSCIIGVITFVGLSLMGVKYAAALALIAALLEFIPYLGPIVAAIPAFIIGFSQGGIVLLLMLIAFYIIVQQVENHILVPKIMQRAVGLNPIVSIIALLIGAQVAGILGAILAIPLGAALSVLFTDVIQHQRTI